MAAPVPAPIAAPVTARSVPWAFAATVMMSADKNAKRKRFFMTFPNRERCSSAAEFHSSRTREVDESSVKNRLIQRQPVGLVPLGSSTPGRERARQRISTMRTRIVFSPPAALTVGFRLTVVAAAQQHCAGALTSRIPWRHQSGNTPYPRDQAIAESAPAGHL